MNKKLNKFVAINIIKAQISSDGGKGICELRDELKLIDNASYIWDAAKKHGYCGKDSYIFKAIEYIRTHRNCGFRYSVQDGDIFGSNIVYFWYKDSRGRKQISFHTFFPKINRYNNKKKYKTRWDEGNSRNNCLDLFCEVFR